MSYAPAAGHEKIAVIIHVKLMVEGIFGHQQPPHVRPRLPATALNFLAMVMLAVGTSVLEQCWIYGCR
jgi:hypothetical protein